MPLKTSLGQRLSLFVGFLVSSVGLAEERWAMRGIGGREGVNLSFNKLRLNLAELLRRMEEIEKKGEFPPLRPEGFWTIHESDFERVFLWKTLQPPGFRRRAYLISQLRKYLHSLTDALPTELEIWIDGSFTTYKPNPEDVDLVVFANAQACEPFFKKEPEIMRRLFMPSKGELIKYPKLIFNVDAYLDFADSPKSKTRWINQFGTARNLAKKGIFVLRYDGANSKA